MKKITSILIASALSLTLAVTGISCATSSANTTLPTTTNPPVTTTPVQPIGKGIAEDFIRNSATFKFDGIKGSIQLAEDLTKYISSNATEAYTFGFQTAHPGHGDRTGQFLAEVITKHSATIYVNITDSKIIYAVCDEKWDMLTDKEVTPFIPAALHALALDFVKNSTTFKFDGIIDGLKLVNGVPESNQPQGFIFTIAFQTRHAGHGDRTGQNVAQVITNHTAIIIVRDGKITSAICDEVYDLQADKMVTTDASGTVISGGDTAQPNGPTDVPHKFVYKIQKTDGTYVNVSYTAYPPSPVGDAQKEKILLNFRGGSVQIGDHMDARGTYDKDTNTITVANMGDFIVTYLSEESARKIAEDFIRNSSTFKFDGLAGTIKYIQTDPGWTSSFRTTSFTFEYQTGHPGHGDRTGQYLAQVVTNHKAIILVNIETGAIISAVCDGTWSMKTEKDLPVTVSGIVVSGGDTTPTDGPKDAPRVFVYKVQKADGTFVNVSYTAYPPSPVGDANRAKIVLDFNGGAISMGDKLEALGMLDKATNTLVVANDGDFIKTSIAKVEIIGVVISGGDTTAKDGPLDAPRKFVYKIKKADGNFINVSYTAYPPSPAGDIANAKITLSYYNGEPKPGDYLKAYGTYEAATGTVLVADQGDFIKTYPTMP